MYIYIIKMFCYVIHGCFLLFLVAALKTTICCLIYFESVKYSENYTRAAKRPEVIINQII